MTFKPLTDAFLSWRAELLINDVGDITMNASAQGEEKPEDEYLEAFSDFAWAFAEIE